MNKFLQEIDIPQWMTKRKSHPDPERTSKTKHSQQLQTHNMPNNDVENTYGTN